MELQGKLIKKFATQAISEKFSKREFVIEVENKKNPQYNDKIKLELTQDNCDLIEKFNIGNEIKVSINIKGKEYTNAKQEVSYFNSIQAWKIESIGSNYQMSETMSNSIANSTDLPF
jgi:hypothetical protein